MMISQEIISLKIILERDLSISGVFQHAIDEIIILTKFYLKEYAPMLKKVINPICC